MWTVWCSTVSSYLFFLSDILKIRNMVEYCIDIPRLKQWTHGTLPGKMILIVDNHIQ